MHPLPRHGCIPCIIKAGDGNRTHVSSLEGWCSTIELHPHKVGVTGFEPATPWSQTRYSSQTEPHPETIYTVYFCLIRDASKIIIQAYPVVNNFFHIFYKFFPSFSFTARRAFPLWLISFFCSGESAAEEQENPSG